MSGLESFLVDGTLHDFHSQSSGETCTLYKCTVYSVQCTVYSVQCTSVQCTVYSVQCTSVQCTSVAGGVCRAIGRADTTSGYIQGGKYGDSSFKESKPIADLLLSRSPINWTHPCFFAISIKMLIAKQQENNHS